jgi:hypothetical protein
MACVLVSQHSVAQSSGKRSEAPAVDATPETKTTAIPEFISPSMAQRIARLSQIDRMALAELTAQILNLTLQDNQVDPSGFYWRLHRWEVPVRLWTDMPESLVPRQRINATEELNRLVKFVADNGGPPIELAAKEAIANYWIVLGTPHDFESSDLIERVAARFFAGDLNGAGLFKKKALSQNCAHHVNIVGSFGTATDDSVVQSVSLIRTDVPSQQLEACLVRSFSFSMGFIREANSSTTASWTQLNAAFSRPTEVDGQLLGLLYSSRLKSGMNGSAALPIMLDEAISHYETRETE